jgi:hypothetical protein
MVQQERAHRERGPGQGPGSASCRHDDRQRQVERLRVRLTRPWEKLEGAVGRASRKTGGAIARGGKAVKG